VKQGLRTLAERRSITVERVTTFVDIARLAINDDELYENLEALPMTSHTFPNSSWSEAESCLVTNASTVGDSVSLGLPFVRLKFQDAFATRPAPCIICA